MRTVAGCAGTPTGVLPALLSLRDGAGSECIGQIC